MWLLRWLKARRRRRACLRKQHSFRKEAPYCPQCGAMRMLHTETSKKSTFMPPFLPPSQGHPALLGNLLTAPLPPTFPISLKEFLETTQRDATLNIGTNVEAAASNMEQTKTVAEQQQAAFRRSCRAATNNALGEVQKNADLNRQIPRAQWDHAGFVADGERRFRQIQEDAARGQV